MTTRFAAPRSPRRGFSMAELMIAIVILGLGLLMVATMFPVAWTRARDLAEFTNQTTATEAAQTTVDMLCNVWDGTPAPDAATSFLGDLAGAAPADGQVHVLHMDNAFRIPNAGGAVIWPEGQLDDGALDSAAALFIAIDPTLINWQGVLQPLPTSQVAFHERLIPPLGPLPGVTGPLDAQWNQQLASRRFAWAVLYKLDAPTPAAADDQRSITMFFVTLRRTQSTHRFARQDDQGAVPPLPPQPFLWTNAPQSLAPANDMIFPVPWLVNLQVNGDWTNVPPGSTGIPSEAIANPGGAAAGRLISHMLQTESMLIDRLSGAVYTVKSRRSTGSGNNFDDEATVTLDREIVVADVDDGSNGGTAGSGAVEPNTEDLRDFWVFPPPASRGPGEDDNFPIFEGKQPVVGIETRQMIFRP